jgi:YVTN family beta-propeller protein
MYNDEHKTRVNHRVVTALLLLLGGFMTSASAEALPFAYITNQENSVAVMDTATDTVIATVSVGSGPYGLVVNPAETRVYVTNYFSDTVSVIDTATQKVTATVPVGKGPTGITLTQGTEMVIMNSIDHTVSVIDATTNGVTATTPVGEETIALGPFMGTTAYTVFKTDFNNGVPPEFTEVATTQEVQEDQTLGAGQSVFEGHFLRNDFGSKATLTLTDLPHHTHIGFRFLLAVIDTWNGKGCTVGEDTLHISVDGNLLFSESFENSGCGTATYIPPSGVALMTPGEGGLSAVAHTTTVYNMGLDPLFHEIPHTENALTLSWSAVGIGVQTLAAGTEKNTAWAIENLAVVLNGTKDTDGDGILDGTDNCLEVQNVAQTDSDADKQGNPCDLDDDNDGILDQADNCPLVVNVAQTDTNKDGIGDACAVILPKILIREASIKEESNGPASVVFEVSLSQPTTATLTVDYETSDGTARAGFDYTQRAGTLTFSPGVTTQNVVIPIMGDRLNEQNETFFLNLTKPTLSPAFGVLTLLMHTAAPFNHPANADCWRDGACASNVFY